MDENGKRTITGATDDRWPLWSQAVREVSIRGCLNQYAAPRPAVAILFPPAVLRASPGRLEGLGSMLELWRSNFRLTSSAP